MNLEQLQGQMFAEMQGLGAGGNIFVKMYQLVNKDEENKRMLDKYC